MPVEWVEIGPHRLACGDCLEILPTLEAGSVDCVVTDPPYNVGKDYGIHGDSMSAADYLAWCQPRVEECRRIAGYHFWVAPRYKMAHWLSLLPGAHIVVIRRGARGPLRGGWVDQFQTALAIGQPSPATVDLWEDIRLKGEGYFFREETYDHPGYTPLPIMSRAIALLSDNVVLDPFVGTGTTLVAAERLGRRGIGIEIEQRYFDIACRRLRAEVAQQKFEFRNGVNPERNSRNEGLEQRHADGPRCWTRRAEANQREYNGT